MRNKTKYPGVFYRESKRIGGVGTEKVYYAVFKRNGKTIETKVGRQYVDDMTPAKANVIRNDLIEGRKRTKKEKRIEQQLRETEKIWTFQNLFDEYIRLNPSIKSLKQARSWFNNHVRPALGNKQPAEVLPLDIDRIRISISKHKSTSTVNNVLELIRRLSNFASEKQICPALNFKVKLPNADSEKTEFLTDSQLEKLLKVLDGYPDKAVAGILKMALFTGMRRKEILDLRWADCDFENRFIKIRDAKSGKKEEKIPMNDLAYQVLKSQQKKYERVFFGRSGTMRRDIKAHTDKIKRNVGLPDNFRPLHGLRHTYASRLASSGQVDLYSLQKLMTHKSYRMVQRYAHLADDALKRASNVTSDIFKGKSHEIRGRSKRDDVSNSS